MHQEIARHALAGVLQRGRRTVQVAFADQAYEAIPQVLTPEKHEDHHHDDDAPGCQWFYEWPDERLQHLQGWKRWRDHLDG